MQAKLNAVYAPAMIDWQVEPTANSSFDVGADGLAIGAADQHSGYTPQMKALLSAYFGGERVKDPETNYIFVVPKFTDSKVQGYMPRGRNVGFVSLSDSRNIAHELGHGAFGLEHTFDKNADSKNNHAHPDMCRGGHGKAIASPVWWVIVLSCVSTLQSVSLMMPSLKSMLDKAFPQPCLVFQIYGNKHMNCCAVGCFHPTVC